MKEVVHSMAAEFLLLELTIFFRGSQSSLAVLTVEFFTTDWHMVVF